MSLSQCGLRVTLLAAALRREEMDACVARVSTCHSCRELSLQAVDCAGLQRRRQGSRLLLSGRESASWRRNQLKQLKRCTVVRLRRFIALVNVGFSIVQRRLRMRFLLIEASAYFYTFSICGGAGVVRVLRTCIQGLFIRSWSS